MNKLTRQQKQPRAGKGSGYDNQDKYLDERVKKSVGRFMPTFAYDKESEVMSTYDDTDYLVMLGLRADPDGCAKLAAGCEKGYEIGAAVANMKEEVAAELTAMKDVIEDITYVLLELNAQWVIKKVMANPPRCDTATALGNGATGNTAVACFEESTLADILLLLRDVEFPTVCHKVADMLSVYFKAGVEWVQGEKNIPPRYFMYYGPYEAAADMKTRVKTIRSNQAKMRMHCQKFGIKTMKWSDGLIKSKELNPMSLEAVPLFATLPTVFRDSTDTAFREFFPTGNFRLDGSEDYKFWFKEDPNENELNAIVKLMNGYNATYNPYGGIFGTNDKVNLPSGGAAAQDNCGVRADYTEGTEFLGTTIAQQFQILSLFYAWYCNDSDIDIEVQGTYISNFKIKSGDTQYTWPHAEHLQLKFGDGKYEGDTDSYLVNWLRKQLFGG